MSRYNTSENGVNEAGTASEGLSPGRCPITQQGGPGRYQETAKMKKIKWTKEFNKVVTECYLRSRPEIRGYRKRMVGIWNEIGLFPVTEAQLTSQARCIRERDWLSDVEIEEIKRRISETGQENNGIAKNRGRHEEAETGVQDNGNFVEETMGDSSIGGRWHVELTDEITEGQQVILDMVKTKIKNPEELEEVNLRTAHRKKTREKTMLVNEVIDRIRVENSSDTNLLVLAGANVVVDLLGIKKRKGTNQQPWWKRRMQAKIQNLRKDLIKLEELKNNNLRSERKTELLERQYHIKNKRINAVVEELKQRIKAKTAKTRKYEERSNQFMQNRLFQTNQKRLFEKLEGIKRRNYVRPDAEESITFWSNIWSKSVQHNETAEWLEEVKNQFTGVEKEENIKITKEMVKNQLGKMPKLKASGPDYVNGY